MSKVRSLPIIANLHEASRNAALYRSDISLSVTQKFNGALWFHDNRLYMEMGDTNQSNTTQDISLRLARTIYGLIPVFPKQILILCVIP